MSNQPKIYKYKDLSGLSARLRGDLVEHDFVLLYAHNGTGKTRLSIEFKNPTDEAQIKQEQFHLVAFHHCHTSFNGSIVTQF